MRSVLASNAWLVTSLLVIVVIAITDVVDGHSSLVGSLAVAPFLASAMCTPARTAVVSAVSVLVGAWLLATQGTTTEALTIAVRGGVVLTGALLAPWVAAQRITRERRIQDLKHVAETAQHAVLTPIPPVAGPTRLASAYQSASREAFIGGDLYGVVETSFGVRLVVGDVRGKGIDAVKVAAVALAAFREGTRGEGSLSDVARYADAQLRRHLLDEDFVTAVFADIDHDGGVELVSCGHPPPMLARGADLVQLEIPDPGTPLGFSLEIRSDAESERLLLQRGDRLLFYTDGLVEARDRSGRFVDVARVVGKIGDISFDEALSGVVRRLHDEAREVRDDLALLLLEYTGSSEGTDRGSDDADRTQVARAATPTRSHDDARVTRDDAGDSPLVLAGRPRALPDEDLEPHGGARHVSLGAA